MERLLLLFVVRGVVGTWVGGIARHLRARARPLSISLPSKSCSALHDLITADDKQFGMVCLQAIVMELAAVHKYLEVSSGQ